MKLLTYADRDMMAIDLAQKIAGELTAVLMHEDRALLVVPGGTTPGPIFDALCAADLDWGRVDILLSDERWVPADHPRSNTRLVQERLMVGRASAARMLPLYAPAAQPELVLAQLEQVIRPYLPVSVALLGMGDDMHTASLFPDGDNLAAALAPDAPVLVAMRTPSQPEARVSLTARVLREAISLHIVITGAEKQAALMRAQDLPPEQTPVSAVLDDAMIHWVD